MVQRNCHLCGREQQAQESSKHLKKYENGDYKVVGVQCAGDLGKRRKNQGATPIQNGMLHLAVKEF